MAQHLFVREETKKRLKEAVEAVEARSSAEVVIAVRPRSANWLWVDLLVGVVLGNLGLLYMLFAPQVFGLIWIALIVPTLTLAGVFITRVVRPLRFALAGGQRLDAAVRDGARARFVELNVAATRERTGMLVYLSLQERRCVVVADVGVIGRLTPKKYEPLAAGIEATIAEHGMGPQGLDALCNAVAGLADHFEEPLPRREDDTNELEDVA